MTLPRRAMRLAVLGPISIARLVRGAARAPGASAVRSGTVELAVVALQFLPLVYTLHAYRPHPRAWESRRAPVARPAELPGPVLVPDHGFYDRLAGKGTSLQIIALDDIPRPRGNPPLARDPGWISDVLRPVSGNAFTPTYVYLPVAPEAPARAGAAARPGTRAREPGAP